MLLGFRAAARHWHQGAVGTTIPAQQQGVDEMFQWVSIIPAPGCPGLQRKGMGTMLFQQMAKTQRESSTGIFVPFNG